MKKRIWFAIVFALLVALRFIEAIGPVLSGPLRAARPETNVKHEVPALAPGTSAMHFSNDPTDEEFRRVGLFVQPLIPSGRTTREENRDLADALCAYASAIRNGSQDSVAPILDYLDTHPKSAWRAVLQLELGAIYRRTGHLSKALHVWQACWNNSKTLSDPNGRAIGDMAVAYLSQFEAYLGRKQALQQLLNEVKARPVRGAAAELVSESSSGLADMNTMSEWAFKCGPSALARILAIQNPHASAESRGVLNRARSTPDGLSLRAVQAISVQTGMNYQMAFRSKGVPAIIPAVVHWKVGHFAALLGKEADAGYWVGDPTFGEDIVISPSTLDEEASGYFLVPPGPLPNGWRSVDTGEGDRIWGRGDTGSNHDIGATGRQEIHAFGDGSCGGCSTWNVEAMVDGLSLHDDPVGYTPPIGPPVRFQMDYSHRDAMQPISFGYTNFGNKWTTEWLSYIDVGQCPTVYGSASLSLNVHNGSVGFGMQTNFECDTLYRRGGGAESYSFDVTDQPHPMPRGLSGIDSHLGQFSQGVFTKLLDPKANNKVVGYWRTLPDGSVEKFELPYNYIQAAGGKFFMTEVDDPQGNAVKITWDNQSRIIVLTDALGQATTVCYNDSWRTSPILCAQPSASTNPPSNLQVTQVRDPSGRSAFFGYDPVPLADGGTGHLTSITDVLGITSKFAYAKESDFISSLTTPYGVTNFAFTDSTTDNTAGSSRSVTIFDPLNRTSRVEFRQGDTNCTSAGTTGDATSVESHFIACTERATPSGMPALNSLLQYRNTFIWDPYQYQIAFGNGAPPAAVYGSAKLIHWLHANWRDTNKLTASRIPESFKPPLEHRTWLAYENQTDNLFGPGADASIGVGSTNQPTAIGRLLDDGRTQLWTVTYNSYGKITQSTDPIGRQLTLAYDTNGIDLLNVTNTTTVNGSQQKDLLVTYTNYNSQHEPQKLLATNGLATTFSYNAAGQVVASTDPLGNTWSYSYQPSNGGYLQQITGPAGPQVPQYSFKYDALGRISQSIDPVGGTLNYAYDQADRITRVVFPDRTSQSFSYTLLDLTSLTDRKSNTIVRHYDADREVTEIDELLNRTTLVGYAPNGALQTLTDPNGFATTWTRDLEGRAAAVKYADSTGATYTYDGNGRVIAVQGTTANPRVPGVTVNYGYNLDDTLSAIVPEVTLSHVLLPAAQVNVPPTFFIYDSAYRRLTGWEQKSENGTNNPTINSFEQITYAPANSGLGANRVSGVLQATLDNTRKSKGYIQTGTGYVYDALDRVTYRFVTPNDVGRFAPTYTETFAYDALGRVISNNNTLDSFSYGYSDATTRVTSRQSSGSFLGISYYAPQSDELPQGIAYFTPPPVVLPFAEYSYQYDSNRNVTGFTEFSLEQGNSSTAYTYDAFNQLLSASAPGGQNGVDYGYDANGNLTSWTTVQFGIPFGRTRTNYDAANAITMTTNQPLIGQTTTSTADYDVSANLTSINGINYKYDRLNRLVEASWSNHTSDFIYDGVGRLVQVIDNTGGQTVKSRSYGWCGGARCVEYDNTKQVPIANGTAPFADRLYYGQGLVDSPSNNSGDGLYYIADALGSVRGLAHSAANNPYADPTVTRYDYDPYGSRARILGNGPDSDLGFAGYFHHEATGLEFTRNRVYSPQLQRWLTRDPLSTQIAFAGGGGFKAAGSYRHGYPRSRRSLLENLIQGGHTSRSRPRFRPQFNASGLNLYAYAQNTPMTLRDPSGLSPDWPDLGEFAAEWMARVLVLFNILTANPEDVNEEMLDAIELIDEEDVEASEVVDEVLPDVDELAEIDAEWERLLDIADITEFFGNLDIGLFFVPMDQDGNFLGSPYYNRCRD